MGTFSDADCGLSVAWVHCYANPGKPLVLTLPWNF